MLELYNITIPNARSEATHNTKVVAASFIFKTIGASG
jgi:hypothetical protein